MQQSIFIELQGVWNVVTTHTVLNVWYIVIKTQNLGENLGGTGTPAQFLLFKLKEARKSFSLL